MPFGAGMRHNRHGRGLPFRHHRQKVPQEVGSQVFDHHAREPNGPAVEKVWQGSWTNASH